MTFAEVERALQSYNRRKNREAKEKAHFDYTLAELIGRSISRLYSSTAKMPAIEEAYSNIFKEESKEMKEKQAMTRAELSVLRFKQYAQAHNKKFTGGVKD